MSQTNLDKYGFPTVVFDGYESGPSTKTRRTVKGFRPGVGAEVHFTGDMLCTKHRFITLLTLHLKRYGINVLHAEADVDVLVVQPAVPLSELQSLVAPNVPFMAVTATATRKTKETVIVPFLGSQSLWRCQKA